MFEVKYKKDVLDFVSKICNFNNEVTFFKEQENVVVRQRSEGQVFSLFRTKKENFDFDGDKISFFDFPNFFKFFKSMKEPVLFQNENKMVISKDKTKINYLLSDPEVVGKSSFNELKMSDPTVSFLITEDVFKEISDMVSILGAENVKFTFEKDVATIMLFRNGNENSFEKQVPLQTPVSEKIEYEIKSYFFSLGPALPFTASLFFIGERPVFRFSYANDVFSVDFVTACRADNHK